MLGLFNYTSYRSIDRERQKYFDTLRKNSERTKGAKMFCKKKARKKIADSSKRINRRKTK